MAKYLFFSLSILFFSCALNKTEEMAQQKDTLSENIQQKDSAAYAEHYEIDVAGPDSLKIATLKFYAATWDASYFPLPSINLLLTDSGEELFYAYLIENFDTLSTRVPTEHYEIRGTEEDESNAAQVCAWKQQFKSNISYSSSLCSESGEAITIETHCPDKKILVRLVDIFYHTNENSWNSDSTKYTPMEGEPGCYYLIDKNNAGNYTIEYYCGC